MRRSPLTSHAAMRSDRRAPVDLPARTSHLVQARLVHSSRGRRMFCRDEPQLASVERWVRRHSSGNLRRDNARHTSRTRCAAIQADAESGGRSTSQHSHEGLIKSMDLVSPGIHTSEATTHSQAAELRWSPGRPRRLGQVVCERPASCRRQVSSLGSHVHQIGAAGRTRVGCGVPRGSISGASTTRGRSCRPLSRWRTRRLRHRPRHPPVQPCLEGALEVLQPLGRRVHSAIDCRASTSRLVGTGCPKPAVSRSWTWRPEDQPDQAQVRSPGPCSAL
jgi:hypothetical protein